MTENLSALSYETESLKRSGEIAADYIEKFLDICDLAGDIDIRLRDSRVQIVVKSDESWGDLNLLGDPNTVKALRDLMVLAVKNATGNYCKINLIIGDSQKRREENLRRYIEAAIRKIQEEEVLAVALPHMSSYDRKTIHDLAAELGYTSYSEGVGSDRHTIIAVSV